MDFTVTERGVEFTISQGRFSDLVRKLHKETKASLTVEDIMETIRGYPEITQLPFGEYHLHFFPEGGNYWCTLAHQTPSQDNQELKNIVRKINIF